MAERWADTAARKPTAARRASIPPGALARARLSRPHRQEPRRRRGAFLLANGRGARRSGLAAGARAVPGGGGVDRQRGASRILLAAPIALAEIEARFADRIETARRSPSIRPGLAARAARAVSARSCSAEQIEAGRAERRHRANSRREGIVGARHRQPAVEQGARCSCATACVPAPREGDEWPDLSDAALARTPPNGWRRCSPARPRCASRRRRTSDALDALLPWALRGGSTPRRRPISPRRPARACRSTTRPRRAEAGDPGAGAVRPRRASDASPAGACRWCSSCCRRRTGRCR